MYIYADNAATTKTSQAAIKAMNECMEDFYGNPSSLHSVGQRAAEKLLQARMDVAECLGADFKEIYLHQVEAKLTIRQSFQQLHLVQKKERNILFLLK